MTESVSTTPLAGDTVAGHSWPSIWRRLLREREREREKERESGRERERERERERVSLSDAPWLNRRRPGSLYSIIEYE